MYEQTQTCGAASHILEFFIARNVNAARPLAKAESCTEMQPERDKLVAMKI